MVKRLKVKMVNKIEHNCCNENNFEWNEIAGEHGDMIICKICKRKFVELEDVNELMQPMSKEEMYG